MKKMLFALALFLFCSTGWAQEAARLTTYKNCVAKYNAELDKMIFGEYHYSNITFKFYDDYISADDAGGSVYRIIKKRPVEEKNGLTAYKIDCIDEQNRECTFCVYDEKGQRSIAIVYATKIFFYIIDSNEQ